MKKFMIGFISCTFLISSAMLPVASVMAAETAIEATVEKPTSKPSNIDPRVSISEDENGDLIVTRYESLARANVYSWGKWTYTNIAVTTGVAANAINAAFYAGLGASVAMFGIPGWVIGGLLTGASWTSLGSSPGNAVAKKWDKNGNGWIGFYKRSGLDGAGRVVATEYKTE